MNDAIHDSEIEDFKNGIKRLGHSIEDFHINGQSLTHWEANAIVPIQGMVSVKRKSTNIERSYNAGNLSHWVVDCLLEIKDCLFDK
jgi:hypothetical protein